MSFAGYLDFVMDGFGIESVFKAVYGEDTVKHMLGGKAIAEALRAHILLESALTIKLQQILFNDGKENTITPYDILTAEKHGRNRDDSFVRPGSLRNGKC